MASIKATIDGLIASLFPTKTSSRIMVLGLDAVGKTTFLYRMKLGEIVVTIPTIGFNVEEIRLPTSRGRLDVVAWDVGGCDKIRPLWRHYFQALKGAIFMIDANDRERLSESLDECRWLQKELKHDDAGVSLVPLLIFANKQDLPNAMTAEEIHERALAKLPFPSHWKVFPLSAIASNEELLAYVTPGFDWLYEMVNTPRPNPTDATSESKEVQRKDDIGGPRSSVVLKMKFEDWIAKLDADVSPEEFLQQFRELRLPAWDHYTHIRLAFVILTTYGRQKGKNMIFDGIQHYIENSDRTTGKSFHLTMTYFWIQMVHYGIRQTPVPVRKEVEGDTLTANDFGVFLLVNPFVVDGNLWEDYYTREVIMTPKAKEEMTLPDKKPLPNIVAKELAPKLRYPFDKK